MKCHKECWKEGNQEEIDKYMLSKGIDLKFDNEVQFRESGANYENIKKFG